MLGIMMVGCTGYPQGIIERGPSEIGNEFLYDNGFAGAPACMIR